MPLYNYIIVYAVSLLTFFLVDLIWLGLLAKSFYQRQLGDLLAARVNWPSAIVFYLIYIIGLMIFSIIPAAGRSSFAYAASWGALYGFFTYATYELTNYALIKKWPFALVPVDIAWGVVLCTIVACAGYAAARWLQS
jgi:uncharacterized membrane protein